VSTKQDKTKQKQQQQQQKRKVKERSTYWTQWVSTTLKRGQEGEERT